MFMERAFTEKRRNILFKDVSSIVSLTNHSKEDHHSKCKKANDCSGIGKPNAFIITKSVVLNGWLLNKCAKSKLSCKGPKGKLCRQQRYNESDGGLGQEKKVRRLVNGRSNLEFYFLYRIWSNWLNRNNLAGLIVSVVSYDLPISLKSIDIHHNGQTLSWGSRWA